MMHKFPFFHLIPRSWPLAHRPFSIVYGLSTKVATLQFPPFGIVSRPFFIVRFCCLFCIVSRPFFIVSSFPNLQPAAYFPPERH